ncbi:uncharacterized protein BKA55DRAFT_600532 [Fusarium redolens]|uniref:NAD(P)-binding protein n=1 Tax=Fusarium redolens TaxID=48865 RepID=A0A9P9FXL2_FUSRE|nr:uncharacterized protein BKA55DRAFT_600532 [Fusarium redolens]KAH7202859.1 hypothetical protein BKA55DRAFT_600532 [Fusarium redolens]
MASTRNTVWVVTGGNRGIGLGLVKALLARPSITVIATVRNKQARSAIRSAVADLPKGDGTAFSIIQLNFATALGPKQIRNAFNINHVDLSALNVVNVSSSVSYISYYEVIAGIYRPSKAALNWLMRAPYLQNKGLIAFALYPGFITTDIGKSAAINVKGAVKGSLKIIDSATREAVSGKFVSYKGQELPW